MLALAKYSLKGPYHAATVVGLLAVMSVYLPYILGNAMVSAIIAMACTLMSGTLVGLIILTQGSASGIKAILVSIAGITLVAFVVSEMPTLGIMIGLVQWLPIIILAQTLRSTNSLALMILAGALLATLAVIVQAVLWPNLEADWLALLENSMVQFKDYPGYDAELLKGNMQAFLHWLVIALAASFYLLFVSMLLLARSTQAKLTGSKGYLKEFRSISLGKPAAIGALILTLLGFGLEQNWLTSIALLAICAFLYQGIAVVHCKAAASKQTRFILVMFYLMLLIFPQVVVVTAVAGMLDNWLIFRKNTAYQDDINEN